MAGAILVRDGLNYSCGSMMFSALALEMESRGPLGPWSVEWDVVKAVGAISLLGFDGSDVRAGLCEMGHAALSLIAREQPPSSWEYERSYWNRVRIAAPELLGFLAHALAQVDAE